jgi:hypothetical protein
MVSARAVRDSLRGGVSRTRPAAVQIGSAITFAPALRSRIFHEPVHELPSLTWTSLAISSW